MMKRQRQQFSKLRFPSILHNEPHRRRDLQAKYSCRYAPVQTSGFTFRRRSVCFPQLAPVHIKPIQKRTLIANTTLRGPGVAESRHEEDHEIHVASAETSTPPHPLARNQNIAVPRVIDSLSKVRQDASQDQVPALENEKALTEPNTDNLPKSESVYIFEIATSAALRRKFKEFLLSPRVESLCFRIQDEVIVGFLYRFAEEMCLPVSRETVPSTLTPGHENCIIIKKSLESGSSGQSVVGTADRVLSEPVLDERLQKLVDEAVRPKAGVQISDSYLERFAWGLLRTSCRDIAAAWPSLEIVSRQCEPKSENSSGSDENTYSILKLKNEDFKIELSWRVGHNEPILPVLLEAVHSYGKLLSLKPTDSLNGYVSFDGGAWNSFEYLLRATSELDLGSVTFETKILPPLPGINDLKLHEVHVVTSNQGKIGPGGVWFSEKKARSIAVSRAIQSIMGQLRVSAKVGEILPDDFLRFASYCIGFDKTKELTALEKVQQEQKVCKFKFEISDHVLMTMLSALKKARSLGLRDDAKPEILSKDHLHESVPYERLPDTHDDALKRRENSSTPSRTSQRTHPMEQKLPVAQLVTRYTILRLIAQNDVVIISAATGSGKTTQIPQIILDDTRRQLDDHYCNIICTQPRRISTTSVARRVAYERRSRLGEEVGYRVRFDDRQPSLGNGITYATTGFLLKLFHEDATNLLSKYSHIILDEVHVRDRDTDIILARLRDVVQNWTNRKTRPPKIILMSATLQAKTFKDYFKSPHMRTRLRVKDLEIPGKLFAIKDVMLKDLLDKLLETRPAATNSVCASKQIKEFLKTQGCLPKQKEESQPVLRDAETSLATKMTDEDNDIEPIRLGNEEDESSSANDNADEEGQDGEAVPLELIGLTIDDIAASTTQGDLLIFLPGLGEIDQLGEMITGSKNQNLTNPSRFRVFRLHSALYETNDEVFAPIPLGCRRIILATNIAETSITLPNVRYVLDSGRVRINTYDQVTRRSEFTLNWISKAEATQRRGRAGRVSNGHYFAFYSQEQYQQFQNTVTPEIQRTELTDAILGAESAASLILDRTSKNRSKSRQSLSLESMRPTKGFLSRLPSPPAAENVAAAVAELHRLKAFAEDDRITSLGRFICRVPLNPSMAKSVVLGALFQCLTPVLVAAAIRPDMSFFSQKPEKAVMATIRRRYSGPTWDDDFATIKAFQAYLKAYRDNDILEVQRLETQDQIRRNAFNEMSRVSNQIFHLIIEAFENDLYKVRASKDPPDTTSRRLVFPSIPSELDLYSDNDDLVKAINLTNIGSSLAVWQHRNWRTQHEPRVLVEPRSVNHHPSKKVLVQSKLKRQQGDLLAFQTMRIVPGDKYAWLHTTSRVTPLQAMMFGASLDLKDDNTLVIDGWLEYQIEYQGRWKLPGVSPAKVLFEFRKAIDRFLSTAFQDIAYDVHRIKAVRNRTISKDGFNTMLKQTDHPLRETMVQALAQLFPKSPDEDDPDEETDVTKHTQSKAKKKQRAVSHEKKKVQSVSADSSPLVSESREHHADEVSNTEIQDEEYNKEDTTTKLVELRLSKSCRYLPHLYRHYMRRRGRSGIQTYMRLS